MTCEEALKDLYGKEYADQCKGKTLLQVLKEIREGKAKLKKLIDGLIDGKPSAKAILYRLKQEFGNNLIGGEVAGKSVLLNYKTPYDFIMKISEIYPKSEQKCKFIDLFYFFSGIYYLYLWGANKNKKYRLGKNINFGSKTFFFATLCILGFINTPKTWKSKKCVVNKEYENYLPDSVKHTLENKTACDLQLLSIVDKPKYLNSEKPFNRVLNDIIRPFFENISELSVQTKLGHFNKSRTGGCRQNPTYSALFFLLGRVSAKWLICTDGWRNEEINALAKMMCMVDGKNKGKKQSSLNEMTRDEFLKLYFAPLCVDPIKECKRLKDKLKSEKAELENDKKKISEIGEDIDKLGKVINKGEKVTVEMVNKIREQVKAKLENDKEKIKEIGEDIDKLGKVINKGKKAIIEMVNKIIERVREEFEKVEPKQSKNRSKSENKNYSKTGDNGERSEASKSVGIKNKKVMSSKKFFVTRKEETKDIKQANEDSKGFVNQNMIIESGMGKNEIDSKEKHNSIQGSQSTVSGEKENNQNIMTESSTKKVNNNTALQDNNYDIETKRNSEINTPKPEMKSDKNENNNEISCKLLNRSGENSTNGYNAFYDRVDSFDNDSELGVYRGVFSRNNSNNLQNYDDEIDDDELYFVPGPKNRRQKSKG